MNKRKPIRHLVFACAAGLAAIVAGCGGSNTTGGSGSLTLHITDAPVDSADQVHIQFHGVEVKGAGAQTTYYYCKGTPPTQTVVSTTPCTDYAPRQIDLLPLTDGETDVLLDDIPVPAGRYEWVRLLVDTEGTKDSYIVLPDGWHELVIPSGDENGLKLHRAFDVPDGGSVKLIVDFDLRKSVHLPMSGTDYLLRPTLRVVDVTQVGDIAGTVHSSRVTTGCTPAVYVFAGSGVTPDDIDANAPEPVTTANVTLDNATGKYVYRAAYLEVGAYTVAFTCQAEDDVAGIDNAISFPYETDATVSAGTTTTVDVPAATP